MKNLSSFNEGTTDSYEAPKFAVRPATGDKGNELVRQNYNRWLWVTPKLNKKKGALPKGPGAPNINKVGKYVGESSYVVDQVPIPSAIGNDSFQIGGDVIGYRNRKNDKSEFSVEDPDKKKKKRLKNLVAFSTFTTRPSADTNPDKYVD